MAVDSHNNVPSSPLAPARLSLTEAVNRGRRNVAQAIGETSAAYRGKVIIAGAFTIAALGMTGASLHNFYREKDTNTALRHDLLGKELELVRASTQAFMNRLAVIRSGDRANLEVLTNARHNLTLLSADITAKQNVLNLLKTQRASHTELNNDFLQLSGQMIRLQLEISTLQGELAAAATNVVAAQAIRVRQVQAAPLAVAAEEQRARRLPCDNDALRASCNDVLHGITCYAFTPADPRRALCEIVKPLCNECNLR